MANGIFSGPPITRNMPDSQMNEKVLLAQVGAGIRAWRKKAGLTMNQLAELADIDGGFLATIEIGKKAPSVVTLAKLAKALDIRIGVLLDAVPQDSAPMDAKLEAQFRSLAHGRGKAEKANLLAILRKLHDPERVKALRKFI
jgi:transcriptional regulator with XRE-family HTH domain